VDPGTLNPYEHGECFVTEDGAETDLDLGHYERYLDINTSQANNVTTGRVYQTVINKEREGEYLGKTVQVIPHITDEIKRRMLLLDQSGKYDFVITEIGGTVGDIESLPYIEAIRQLTWELGEDNCIVCHLTLIPYLSAAKELKTKPTQHSVKILQEWGINPDILVCRTEHTLPEEMKEKIARFCNVRKDSVIESLDANTIYDVPLLMKKEGLDQTVLKKFKLDLGEEPSLERWNDFLYRFKNPKSKIKVGLVGKYVELQDAYKSILESFIHAGAANECKIDLHSIHSEEISSENVKEKLGDFDAILVAPGFGERGIDGKIIACQFARENKVPFLGICLGMQICVVEYFRNELGFDEAHSSEINPDTQTPVINLMEEQKSITKKGGTMRLGSYDCILSEGSKTFEAYGKRKITERHRHRYEFNNNFMSELKNSELKPVGINPDNGLVEVVELEGHPWYVGVQYHPEYKSTVLNPAPLFVDLYSG
jgi:CTP synthase